MALLLNLKLCYHPLMSISQGPQPCVMKMSCPLQPPATSFTKESRLHPDAVEIILRRYSRAEVDLFTSELSSHCPLCFSLLEKTSPLGQDALAHAWPECLFNAFPPVPLILGTLDRVIQGNHIELLVGPQLCP
ncbi:hypothetical protein SKAU_G00105250 [Synaphobranchus kaupii]|uniref:Uncharacterized protein n=1 Tax=Synaphobranchus kaupii TaxID=118154 RepID=A0A9Q1FZK8_SYNKA|nr:hypothetical protein SKAU_G00105250 [Synaphobranchus kaupii]